MRPTIPFPLLPIFGQPITLLAACFHVRILLGLFQHEDGGYMFIRNFDWLSTGFKALYSRR
jgi:hypothetical protein